MNQEQINILKNYRYNLLFFIKKKKNEYGKEDMNGQLYTAPTALTIKKEFDLNLEYERVSELLGML